MDRTLLDRLIDDLRNLRDGLSAGGAEGPAREVVDRATWLTGLLALSPDVISVLDRDGRLRYLNRAAGGRDPQAFVGRLAAEFLPEGHRQLWEQALARVLDTGMPQQFEVHSAGDYWWETRLAPLPGRDGGIDHVLSIGVDVTARRRAEAALAIHQEMLALALEASGLGQWRWELDVDRVVLDGVGRRLFELGDDRDTFQAREIFERIAEDDRARVEEHLRAAARTGQPTDLEFRLSLPGGSRRWVLLKGRRVTASSAPAAVAAPGDVLIGAVVDVSINKQKEEGLQRAQKLEAIGQLAGGVAHDFNNLLVAITGSIELARREGDAAGRDALLYEALKASQRAAELTRQLLVFSRKQPLHETAIDMNALLQDTMKLLRRLIPESIEIDLIAGHRLPRILGDRGQIEQVVINLCINARDAMPSGGRLVLETESVLVNGRFRDTHPWARPGRYVLLSITDSGVGMSSEVLARIFEPFFTTKEQGTGLGLATAYGIVKQHGGLLHAYSEPGKGSIFKVYLPIATRDAAEVGSKIEAPVVGGKECILLAEDEDSVRAIVHRILEQAGYRVELARDGVEAIALFERVGDAVQLLLLDAIMPRMNGTQVLTELRRRRPDLPAIVSSGYSDSLASVRMSGVAFLQKPYEPDTLLRAVREALDGRSPTKA